MGRLSITQKISKARTWERTAELLEEWRQENKLNLTRLTLDIEHAQTEKGYKEALAELKTTHAKLIDGLQGIFAELCKEE